MTSENAKRCFPQFEFLFSLNGGERVFVKSSDADIFGQEAEGLNALRSTDAIRVAEVIGLGQQAGRHFLVLEAIESQTPGDGLYERFGYQLAEMHRCGTSDSFGFHRDNFIGETDQPNDMSADWTDFWAQSRLRFQLKLARERGFAGQLQQLGESLVERLDGLIGGQEEKPALIHGDLWSGNWMCDHSGQPALIDPAVYFANREAEFGMTTLFGGLPQAFYDAYNEALPLKAGWQDRVAIYRLYHLLNHLNLFGESYLSQCLAILKRFS